VVLANCGRKLQAQWRYERPTVREVSRIIEAAQKGSKSAEYYFGASPPSFFKLIFGAVNSKQAVQGRVY
jgi:hypothetical protein